MKKLIICRGSPGSGKSTYARRVKAKMLGVFGLSCTVASADDYFVKNGIYTFDRTKLSKAHEYCRDQVHKAMIHNSEYILLDNTNISRPEFKPYIELAKEFGYQTIEKVFGLDATVDELVKRGTHNVPREKVELMARKLVDSVRNVEGQTVHKVNDIMTIRIKR
jgi:predicted kinase